MRLDEINKATFHRKLADPAAQELYDIKDDLRNTLYPMRFKIHDADKDVAIIECISPWDDEGEYVNHLEGVNIVLSVQRRIAETENWVWDTSKGDADDVLYCYVIRK